MEAYSSSLALLIVVSTNTFVEDAAVDGIGVIVVMRLVTMEHCLTKVRRLNCTQPLLGGKLDLDNNDIAVTFCIDSKTTMVRKYDK